MAELKENDNSNTKQEILDAFKTHFSHFGYKKTSVNDIAKELKISKKTIYRFFSSKEKIFYYIISRVARGIRNDMEKKLDSAPTYEAKIDQLLRMIFDQSRRWLKRNDAFEFKYKYEIAELAFKEAFGELLQKLLEAGIEAKEFPATPVDLKIRFIQGIISESMRILTANPDLQVEDEVIYSVMKMIR